MSATGGASGSVATGGSTQGGSGGVGGDGGATGGIGGTANTFRSACNFVTNDPRMYKTVAPAHESRYAKLGLNSAMDEYTVKEPIN